MVRADEKNKKTMAIIFELPLRAIVTSTVTATVVTNGWGSAVGNNMGRDGAVAVIEALKHNGVLTMVRLDIIRTISHTYTHESKGQWYLCSHAR